MITSFFATKKRAKPDHIVGEVGTLHSGNGTKRTRSEGNEVVEGKINQSSEPKDVEVEKLLEHLQDGDDVIPDVPECTTWRKALETHTSSHGFKQLAKFVVSQREKSGYQGNCSGAVYPPPHETFASLNLTPMHSVRVVVVGQDPYHGYNQGHGLAFSVKKGVAIPPSLRNIYKELSDDPDIKFDNHGSAGRLPRHGNLERWARQGVLLLNSVLTVRDGEANSHARKGWESFTDEIIRVLDKHSRANGKGGLIFLLWGKPASKKAERIIDKKRHTVICTSHPSPLGAAKTNAPFLGSRCFSRANAALMESGMDPIDWNVDDDPAAE